MNVDWLNGTAAACAVLASAVLAGSLGQDEVPELPRLRRVAASEVVERGGVRGLVDASGRFVPVKPYRRIISASSVADSLLLALGERSRIAAVSHEAGPGSPLFERMQGLPVLASLDDLERVLSYSPDLVLVNNLDRIERARQLREAGVEVFDLGAMHGLSTLLPNIRSTAALLGRAERGVKLARRLARRMRSIAADVPPGERPGALYLGVHGDKLYGGTRGTSFHDVLTAAGLNDVAAQRFAGWPRFDNEQLLMLDPEIVVTQRGMRAALCMQAGLSSLRACGPHGRVIELPPELILLPGLNMLDAAQALHDAVYDGP